MQKRLSFFLCVGFVTLILLLVSLRLLPERKEREQRAATLAQLEGFVRQDPTDGQALYYLGLRYRDLGRVGPARVALRQASKLSPEDREIYLAGARLAMQGGADGEADAIFREALLHLPKDALLHREYAVFLADRALYRDANREARGAVALNPGDATAYRLSGLTALSMEPASFVEAEGALRKAVSLSPTDWRSWMALGDACRLQEKWEEAVSAYRQAAKIAPVMAQPPILASLGAIQVKRAATTEALEEAFRTLSLALKGDQTSTLALQALAQVRVQQGKLSDGLTFLEQAESLDPLDKSLPYGIAVLYRKQGNLMAEQAALQRFHRLVDFMQQRQQVVDAQNQGSYLPKEALRIARLCAQFDDFAEARRQYRRLLKEPEYAEIAEREGAVLLERWNRRHAEEIARFSNKTVQPADKLVSIDPLRMRSLLADARRALQDRRYDEAISAGRSLNAQQAETADAFEIIGLAADRKGDIATAFPALKRAVELDPGRTTAAFALAHQYLLAGFTEEARRRLESLVNRAPGEAEYWNALGVFYEGHLANYTKAEAALRKAVELAPNEPEYAVNLARTLAYANRFSEAEALLRDIRKRMPGDGNSAAALGILLERVGTSAERRQEAETLLRSARSRGVNLDRVEMALARILLLRRATDEAIPLIEAVIARQPSSQAFFQLARAYEMAGNRERAEFCRREFEKRSQLENELTNTLEKAQIAPHKAELRQRLAHLYALYGDFAKAINQYQVYLKMRPDDSIVRQQYEKLTVYLKQSGQMPPMIVFDEMVRAGNQDK